MNHSKRVGRGKPRFLVAMEDPALKRLRQSAEANRARKDGFKSPPSRSSRKALSSPPKKQVPKKSVPVKSMKVLALKSRAVLTIASEKQSFTKSTTAKVKTHPTKIQPVIGRTPRESDHLAEKESWWLSNSSNGEGFSLSTRAMDPREGFDSIKRQRTSAEQKHT